MVSSAQVPELVVFITCISLFLLYHVWYFLLPTLNIWPGNVKHINLWITSVRTRSLWAEIVMEDAKEGLLAVQTVRNMIISVSLLATAESALVSTMLNLLTDPQRLQQMQLFALEDPISGGEPLLSPAVKVGLALAALFLSFLTFAACVRLAVHLGFLVRVIPSHPAINLPLRDETILLMQRASLYFTVGLRLLFAFVPLAFYMATGPTAFLVATVLVLVALLALDTVPARQVAHLLRASTMANIEAGMGMPPKMAAAVAESVQGGGLARQMSSISGASTVRPPAAPAVPAADESGRVHHRWHITS